MQGRKKGESVESDESPYLWSGEKWIGMQLYVDKNK